MRTILYKTCLCLFLKIEKCKHINTMIQKEYNDPEKFITENPDGMLLSTKTKDLIRECARLIPEEYGKLYIIDFKEVHNDDLKMPLWELDKEKIYFPCVIEKVAKIESPIYDDTIYETLEKFYSYDGYNSAENFWNGLLKVKEYFTEKYSWWFKQREQCPFVRIWESYHKEELVEKFHIQKTDKVTPYFTNDLAEAEHSINFLNPYWSELVTLYRVWKCGWKSDIVGFQHYRRRFATIPDKVNEGEAYIMKFNYFTRDQDPVDPTRWWLNIHETADEQEAIAHGQMTVYDQFKMRHGEKYIDKAIEVMQRDFAGCNRQCIDYLKSSNVLVPWCSFIMSWDDFCSLAHWLFGVLGKLMEDMQLSLSLEAYKCRFKEEYGDDKYQWRMYSFLGERLISAYLYTNFKCIPLNGDVKESYIFKDNYYNE